MKIQNQVFWYPGVRALISRKTPPISWLKIHSWAASTQIINNNGLKFMNLSKPGAELKSWLKEWKRKKFQKTLFLKPLMMRPQRSQFGISESHPSLDKAHLAKSIWQVTSIRTIKNSRSKNCQKTSSSGQKRFKVFHEKKTFLSTIVRVLFCPKFITHSAI